MNKKLVWGLSFFAFLAGAAGSVLADGMVIHRPDPYSETWDYSDETDQKAFINYQKGLEKMIVSVKIDDIQNKDAVWLFPVPADPAKVVIDVVDELPEMNGAELGSAAKADLARIKDVLFASQIYPMLFKESGYNDYGGMGGDVMLSATKSMAPMAENAKQDVVVYEHLDKEGLSTEIITAKTADGIYEYFKNKGLSIEKGMIPALDAYIGKDYSFVATWIDNGAHASVQTWGNGGDRQYVEDNLDAYLGLPSVQAKLYEMKSAYPELDVEADATAGGIMVNEDKVVPYLQSQEGSAALDELVASIQADSSLDNVAIGSEKPLVDDWSAQAPMPTNPASSYAMPGYPKDYWSEYYYPERGNAKGVSVYFPTDNIYFPLLPTSVYESKTVPATIKVVGYVDPRIYQGIDNFTKVSYYTDAYYTDYTPAGGTKSNFFDGTEDGHYTKIEINAPSKFLTEDLWINDNTPLKTMWAESIVSAPYVFGAVILVLSSIAAAIAAGFVLLKDFRKKPKKLAFIGLVNCLTLIGFTVAAFRAGSGEPVKKENEMLLAKLRDKGYLKKRRNAKIYYALAVFIFLSMTLGLEGLGYMFNSIFYNYDMPYQLGITISLAFIYLPLVLAFLGWRASQVAPEDKPLFAELKAKGCSSWSMAEKSGNRWLFVVLFSALFLLFVWVVVWLLNKTV